MDVTSHCRLCGGGSQWVTTQWEPAVVAQTRRMPRRCTGNGWPSMASCRQWTSVASSACRSPRLLVHSTTTVRADPGLHNPHYVVHSPPSPTLGAQLTPRLPSACLRHPSFVEPPDRESTRPRIPRINAQQAQWRGTITRRKWTRIILAAREMKVRVSVKSSKARPVLPAGRSGARVWSLWHSMLPRGDVQACIRTKHNWSKMKRLNQVGTVMVHQKHVLQVRVPDRRHCTPPSLHPRLRLRRPPRPGRTGSHHHPSARGAVLRVCV